MRRVPCRIVQAKADLYRIAHAYSRSLFPTLPIDLECVADIVHSTAAPEPIFAVQLAFVVGFQNLSVVAWPTSVAFAFPLPAVVEVGVAFLRILVVLAPVRSTRNPIWVRGRLVLKQELAMTYQCHAPLVVVEGQEVALRLQTRWEDSSN